MAVAEVLENEDQALGGGGPPVEADNLSDFEPDFETVVSPPSNVDSPPVPAVLPGRWAGEYDVEKWRVARFKGEPAPIRYLVEGLIPKGVAGVMFSQGGVGKSTLALDLAIRLAGAGLVSTSWLDKFPITEGETVVYLNGEDQEEVIHERYDGLTRAIAEDAGVPVEAFREEVARNLFIPPLEGTVAPLIQFEGFRKVADSPAYRRLWAALHDVNGKTGRPIGMVFVDTRSRYMGAEGEGNSAVAQEVERFSRIATHFDATVCAIHHTNKESYGGSQTDYQAIRGESAFLDNLRFGLGLKPLSKTEAEANGIPTDRAGDHLVMTHAKMNCGPKQGSVILRRDGYRFTLVGSRAEGSKPAWKVVRDKNDFDKVLGLVRETPGISQAEVLRRLSDTVPHGRTRSALQSLVQSGSVRVTKGGGRSMVYYPVERVEPMEDAEEATYVEVNDAETFTQAQAESDEEEQDLPF